MAVNDLGHDLSITNDPSDAVAGFPGMSGGGEQQADVTQSGKPVCNFTYSWSDLSVDVPIKKRRWKCWKERPARPPPVKSIPIIRSLSGVCKSGQFWALMGASGAGKTSLLNSLNFRTDRHCTVTGQRCLNGVPIGPEIISAVSGYLQQDDLLPNVLTCREHLMFTAALRLPRNMTCKQKQNRVDEVLQDVGLWHVKDVYIGGIFFKGISGGEKKRLAFGSEILTDPCILFCDEPTSGLDSFMAKMVVDTMKKMSSRGKLVICTIHQPSTEVFKCFDYLYLLTEGRLAYSGPNINALKFFANVGYECPATYNPADFFVHTLAVVPDYAEECRHKSAEISLAFARSEGYQELTAEIRKLDENAANFEKYIKGKKKSSKYETNCFTQLFVLFIRFCKFQIRDPTSLLAQVFTFAFLGLFLGFSIFQTEMDMQGIGSVTGIIIISMFIQMLLPLYIVITLSLVVTDRYIFTIIITGTDLKLLVTKYVQAGETVPYTSPEEIPLLMREHWNGMYAMLPCYIGRALAETIQFTILPICFFPIVYFLADLSGPIWRLGCHLITMVLCANVGVASGTMVANLSTNVQVAIVNAIVILVPFLLFCGFFADEDKLPIPFKYMKYLSMDFYSAENVMAIQWEGVDKIKTGLGMMSTGKDVLRFYNYENHYVRNTIVLVAMWAFFRITAAIILVLRGRR